MFDLTQVYEDAIVELIKNEYLLTTEIFIPLEQMKELERQYGVKPNSRVKGSIVEFGFSSGRVKVTLNESLERHQFQCACDNGSGHPDRILRNFEIGIRIEQKVFNPKR